MKHILVLQHEAVYIFWKLRVAFKHLSVKVVLDWETTFSQLKSGKLFSDRGKRNGGWLRRQHFQWNTAEYKMEENMRWAFIWEWQNSPVCMLGLQQYIFHDTKSIPIQLSRYDTRYDTIRYITTKQEGYSVLSLRGVRLRESWCNLTPKRQNWNQSFITVYNSHTTDRLRLLQSNWSLWMGAFKIRYIHLL